MGIARAACVCDHAACTAIVDLRVSPISEEDAPDLTEIVRAIAEQRGWLCELPGEPRELTLETLDGRPAPMIARSLGRDLCPQHTGDALQ